MRSLSVCSSANALFVRQGPFNPAESFVHAQNLERIAADEGVRRLYGCCALGMRFVRNSFVPRPALVSLYQLMSGGRKIADGLCIPDMHRMNRSCTASLADDYLKRNARELVNNGCITVSTGQN